MTLMAITRVSLSLSKKQAREYDEHDSISASGDSKSLKTDEESRIGLPLALGLLFHFHVYTCRSNSFWHMVCKSKAC